MSGVNINKIIKMKINPLSSALFKKFPDEITFLTVVCKADEAKALVNMQ